MKVDNNSDRKIEKNGGPFIGKHRLASQKAVYILLLVVLAGLLSLMFSIARYDVPSADDFSFSCETHSAIKSGGNVYEIIQGAANKVAAVYSTWQGTFSAVFFMAFQPSIWGIEYYRFTTYLMVGFLVFSIFLLNSRLYSDCLHFNKYTSGIISVLSAIACTQFLPSPNQSFYWFNGSVYYTFAFSLMLCCIAAALGYYLSGGKWRIILISILCFLLGGNNFVTALSTAILFAGFLSFLCIKKDSRWKSLVIPFVFLLIAFAMNIAAPGNVVRKALFPNHPDAFEAILRSFRSAFLFLKKQMDLRVLSIILFLIPFLWQATGEVQAVSFPSPWMITALSFCFFAAMFTPQLYAMGGEGPDRLNNIIYFSMVILIVFDLTWWLAWIQNRLHGRFRYPAGEVPLSHLAAFAVASAASIMISVVCFNSSLASVAAFSSLRSGEAEAYYQEAMKRQIILENDTVSDCQFLPFEHRPYLLFFTDMGDDPLAYENQDTSTFYGKHSIIVK